MPESRPASRRDFIKLTSVGLAGLAVLPSGLAALTPSAAPGAAAPRPHAGRSMAGFAAPRLDVVRWGLIGLGERGIPMLRETLMLEGCEVTALCDTREAALNEGLAWVARAGKPKPAAYGDGPEAYRRLCERDDVDAVMIMTPGRLHTPMAVAAMRAGKHAFVEVPACVTVEECWQLVEVAEEARRHCMMMENCCYGREELMVLNLCRQGLLGELLHVEASCIRDRSFPLQQFGHGCGSWRGGEHEVRDGNRYPTHGVGPVAQYLGINRGDRFDRLASFSSPSPGMPDFVEKNFPAGHPRRTAKYSCGDVSTAMIKTACGRTVLIQHNTMSPTPYSRHNVVRGTRGIFAGFPHRIYIGERSPQPHRWETDLARWYQDHDHPLWKKVGEIAARTDQLGGPGHGGMDYVMKWRMVQCLREGLPLDQDVYDAAAWTVVGVLTEQSVAAGGAPVEVPDFTRGGWRVASPLGIVS
jgi:hypothetical protein